MIKLSDMKQDKPNKYYYLKIASLMICLFFWMWLMWYFGTKKEPVRMKPKTEIVKTVWK